MISRLILLDTRNFYEVHKVLNTVKIMSRASEQGHPKNFAQKKELKKKTIAVKWNYITASCVHWRGDGNCNLIYLTQKRIKNYLSTFTNILLSAIEFVPGQ